MADYVGKVAAKQVIVATSGEYDEVVLITDEGNEYFLHRPGQQAHTLDPDLARLAGSRVRFEGTVHGDVLVVTGWEVEKRGAPEPKVAAQTELG